MPENNGFEKIDKLEEIVTDSLNRNTKDSDLAELEKKISAFKPYFKNLGNGNNNNIVEFLTKVVFDSNSNVKLDTTADKNKSVHDLLSKENWGKVFGVEKERLNRYGEYDLIYSYIPELAACIDSFRDSIISPDSLVNDSVPIKLTETVVSKEALSIFENNIKALDKKYGLKDLQKQLIGDTLKLGDQFVAVLRYEDELQKLLLKENEKVMLPPEFLDPSLRKEDPIKLNESFYQLPIFENLKDIIFKENSIPGMAMSKEKEVQVNDYYNKVVGEVQHLLDGVKVKTGEEFGKENKDIGVNTRVDLANLDLKGCMVKKLDPRYVVKLEIDGINLGYIYAQKQKNESIREKDTLMKDFFSSRTNVNQDVNGKSKEEIVFNIVGKGIAKKINLDFIEENKEYKDLIYLLLKNEELMKGGVEFIYFNPDEVVHFSIDKDGVYGTSRLAKSLFFAKLYIPSILNEFMQKITRGRDKRVVYVDVGVDEAVEESIQEVVRDIKSKEIQTDKLQSLTTILKSVGNFEDYYIPLWDGEKSIEFDTIQGMDVQSDREWNEFLLKAVIKGTGFPTNYIDASNDVDFARTVIMQNQFLVRKVVSDQESCSESMTKLIRKIYQYEYEKFTQLEIDRGVSSDKSVSGNTENIEQQNIIEEIINNIEVVYSPPVTLNLNNVNDQINNATQTVDFIVNSYFDDQEDSEESKTKKLKFKRKVVEKLVPSIDFDEYDKLFEVASMETKQDILLKKTLKNQEDDMYGDDMYGDDMGGGNFGGGQDPNGGTMDFNGGNQDFDPNQQQDPNDQAGGEQPPTDGDGNPMTGVENLGGQGL